MARSHSLALVVCVLLPVAAAAQESDPTSRQPAARDRGAAPPAAPSSAVSSSARTADEQIDLQVKTLEEKVNDLKERISRTQARLASLREMVIGSDATGGARAVLYHRNEMGEPFVLESVAYALDGAPVYAKADVEGDLDKREELEVFSGRIVPGDHRVDVKLVYRGHGHGVVSDLEGGKFKVQSSYTFNAEPGKSTIVKIVGYEKGDLTTELKDRPSVRYDVDVKTDEAPKDRGSTGSGSAAK